MNYILNKSLSSMNSRTNFLIPIFFKIMFSSLIALGDQNHCWCYIFRVFVVFFSIQRFAIKCWFTGALPFIFNHLQPVFAKLVVKITTIYLFSLDLYIGQKKIFVLNFFIRTELS